MLNLQETAQKASQWVRETGALQIKMFGKKDLRVDSKSTGYELLTEVDELSEKYLLEAIGEAYPEHAILAEESGATRQESDFLWVVDPLDGTTNYARGIPIFVISVALRHKGETVLGLVYNPLLDEMFSAVKGNGAYLNGSRIQVSIRETLREAVLATGFPYDKATHPDNNANYVAHFVPRVRGLRRMGAAAYDLACVAAGRLDGYWEINLGAWDVEAGNLLVTEAGGEIILLPERRQVSLIAGNRIICSEIFEEIKKVDST